MMDRDQGDRELVSSALNGSREATESLVDRHWRNLWRIAHGITGDPVGSEDVVQEAMAAAFARLDRFDPDRGSFRVWLSRITVNRALNWRRDRRPSEPLPGDLAARQPDSAGDQAFLAAIAELSPEHRAVVVLRYGLDYSPQEIAETLELRVGTVHSRLGRALEALRHRTGTRHV
jgi:RNA polymerase sigma-70 factor (ECF subfamily)